MVRENTGEPLDVGEKAVCANNYVVLQVATVLNVLITSVQLVVALRINSLALLADAIQMAVDATTYVISLYAESKRRSVARKADLVELQAATFSVVALLSASVYIGIGAAMLVAGDEEGGGDVDMWLVLGFSSVAVLFDAIQIVLFSLNFRARRTAAAMGAHHTPHTGQPITSGKLNMSAAFLHASGDTMRRWVH
jgi:Co/Zn/Cd efflux system component